MYARSERRWTGADTSGCHRPSPGKHVSAGLAGAHVQYEHDRRDTHMARVRRDDAGSRASVLKIITNKTE